MKILIWLLCLTIYSLIEVGLQYSGIWLGAVPTVILFGITCTIAYVLCKKYDKNRLRKEVLVCNSLDREQFISKCEPFDYKKFMRKPGYGSYYKITGTITERTADDKIWIYNDDMPFKLSGINGNIHKGIILSIHNLDDEPLYKPNACVTAYGFCNSVTKEFVAGYGFIIIPIITVYYSEMH